MPLLVQSEVKVWTLFTNVQIKPDKKLCYEVTRTAGLGSRGPRPKIPGTMAFLKAACGA